MTKTKQVKARFWDITTGMLKTDSQPIARAMTEKPLTTSPDGKLRIGTNERVAYVERLDNRGQDGLTPQQRWDRERLARWATWNPTWHTQQADESEKAKQWFAARFHLRLLVKNQPDDATLAARLKATEDNYNAKVK